MAISVNKVILAGNLTKDVDLRFMPNSDAVANFSIATNETWKDKQGVKQEKVEFHNLVAYRKLAEIIGEYLHKGSSAYFEGKLQTRKWEKDGVTRYTTEILVDTMQMLGGSRETSPEPAQSKQSAPQRNSDPADFSDFDDDIPFN